MNLPHYEAPSHDEREDSQVFCPMIHWIDCFKGKSTPETHGVFTIKLFGLSISILMVKPTGNHSFFTISKFFPSSNSMN
jgi:hypothetical protein